MQFIQNDGGRQAAGFKGQAGDCVTRALAIALNKPYSEVYALVNAMGQKEKGYKYRGRKSSARTGVSKATTRRIMASLGLVWHSCMGIGTGCQVHVRAEELPPGRIIVQLSKHVAAIINGVLHDIHDSSRNGTRCVYGYWQVPQ